jgi:hypothetical protein
MELYEGEKWREVSFKGIKYIGIKITLSIKAA